uniref:Uncharacterized protein n=1 Tax=Phlebotomus papatasi TaxID=29031 RepID=A0A1B0DPG3_PHLPP
MPHKAKVRFSTYLKKMLEAYSEFLRAEFSTQRFTLLSTDCAIKLMTKIDHKLMDGNKNISRCLTESFCDQNEPTFFVHRSFLATFYHLYIFQSFDTNDETFPPDTPKTDLESGTISKKRYAQKISLDAAEEDEIKLKVAIKDSFENIDYNQFSPYKLMKRCCSRGGRKRKHAWELNREFKLGNLLDSKHDGFEKLGQEASDDEITARTVSHVPAESSINYNLFCGENYVISRRESWIKGSYNVAGGCQGVLLKHQGTITEDHRLNERGQHQS